MKICLIPQKIPKVGSKNLAKSGHTGQGAGLYPILQKNSQHLADYILKLDLRSLGRDQL